MKVKDFIQNINWECSSLERVLVDTGTERIELPGEVLRRPASEVWRREFIEALNMTVREARVISVDTMVIFAVGGEGGENMNDRDGSIELRLNTKNVDEALSKVRELYGNRKSQRSGNCVGQDDGRANGPDRLCLAQS